MSETTPPQVADIAAQPDALPLDQLTLIGLFGGPDGGSALLRSQRGDIARVVPGDQVFGLAIAAVADTHVMLTDARGQTFALHMPPG